jgi:ABC-2 type transport system permease protein
VTAVIHAEWTKLRTLRGAKISLLCLFALMAGLGAIVGKLSNTDASFAGQGDDDVVQLALFGVLLAQIAAATLGASLITSEYTTGMIRTTFTAVPRRGAVLGAKAVVLTAAMLPVSVVACATAFLVAQPSLRAAGYVAPAYPPVSLSDPAAVRAVAGTALLLSIYALLALGVGATVRHSGATIALTLGLLFVPFIAHGLLSPGLRRYVDEASPLAGLSAQSTNGRMLGMFGEHSGPLPLGVWGGLAVSFVWAAIALLLACVLLRRRDA